MSASAHPHGPHSHGPDVHGLHPHWADVHGPHAAPRTCPVCGEGLTLTRLGCPACGTELSGSFQACDFCSLSTADREMLGVFLSSRGNMKDLERHLGVSYPTARSRFDAMLGRLGLGPPAGEPEGPPAPAGSAGAEESRVAVLERLARGEIDVDQAERLMGSGS